MQKSILKGLGKVGDFMSVINLSNRRPPLDADEVVRRAYERRAQREPRASFEVMLSHKTLEGMLELCNAWRIQEDDLIELLLTSLIEKYPPDEQGDRS